MSTKGASRLAALAALLLLWVPSQGEASGSYGGRPARPPTTVDRASYELGKKIFAGEFSPSQQAVPSSIQKPQLEELQGGLPRSVRSRVDLVAYSGKLSEDQMEALRYFLAKRYKVR